MKMAELLPLKVYPLTLRHFANKLINRLFFYNDAPHRALDKREYLTIIFVNSS